MSDKKYSGSPASLRSPGRLTLLEVDRVLASVLANKALTSVLDVGTGSAIFAEAFDQAGLSVAGVDIDPRMVEAASKAVPAGDFRQAGASALPFADNSFDLVFLGLVLHEVKAPEQALSEANRVAAKRVAVLEWPDVTGSSGPPRAHRLSSETIRALASEAGFSTIRAVTLTHLALCILDF